MYKKYYLIAVLLFGSTVSVFSQPDKINSLPELTNALSGTWIGSGTTDNGAEFQSKLVFKPVLNGHFFEARNYILVDGAETEFAITHYAWQPVLGHLIFWALDNEGTINEGIAEWDGSILKHEWRSFGANGEIGDWRSELQANKSKLTFVMYEGKNTAIVLNKLVYQKSIQ